MALGPPTGMRDWLPQETILRQRLMETIGSVYRLYGYLPIDTPAMEDLKVLLGKGGGENEKLLFKILKRGDKLLAAREEGDDLADYGLRFDLTVPLARFIASHQGKLPKIFRRYHIAPVWRADRPQQGRYREFYQCDIDVVGGASSAYEVEIITATERVLTKLELGNYRFRLSDKRLLPLLLQAYGAPEEKIPEIATCLDKLDKVPNWLQVKDEVRNIMSTNTDAAVRVENFLWDAVEARKKEKGVRATVEDFRHLWEKIADARRRSQIEEVLENLRQITTGVRRINANSSIAFDPILVRGMDYYTGPIYEAVVENYPSSILGGGRYDGLVGNFLGKPIPAVGCSIGFERILAIQQQGATPSVVPRAVLVQQDQDDLELSRQAERLRDAGIPVETRFSRDDLGKQLKDAEADGILWAIKQVNQDGSLVVRHLPTRKDQTVPLETFSKTLLGLTA
jgi:histidyl-tRNA synthetase